MHRNRVERAFAAVLLLWFACITGAPAALHACPVHDGGSGALVAPGAEHSGAHGAHGRQIPEGGGEHAACTCVGDCSAAGVVPALPAAHARLITGWVGPNAALPMHDSPALVASAFVLPYANGPPGPARVA